MAKALSKWLVEVNRNINVYFKHVVKIRYRKNVRKNPDYHPLRNKIQSRS